MIVFTEVGEVEDILVLDSRRQCWGVEIPAGCYHTILSRAVGSVFYEVKQGPYDPQRAKEFAPWHVGRNPRGNSLLTTPAPMGGPGPANVTSSKKWIDKS